MYDTGEYAISDLAELFSISRPTNIAPWASARYAQRRGGLSGCPVAIGNALAR